MDATDNKETVIEFSEIVRKAYDKGLNEHDLTLEKLIDDLKADLKNLVMS